MTHLGREIDRANARRIINEIDHSYGIDGLKGSDVEFRLRDEVDPCSEICEAMYTYWKIGYLAGERYLT